NDELHTIQSAKKADADAMILEFCKMNKPSSVFLDAPLSLPGVYTNSGRYKDYFYRKCDKELKAMSPMFIGGLTARAIKLKDTLEEAGTKVIEAYPAGIVKELGLQEHYKKDIPKFLSSLQPKLNGYLTPSSSSWHQVDSFLAWLVGLRYQSGTNIIYGEPEEGQIFI
ncbi:MAG: hypothetical protein AAFN93_19140, partial [Bacteroidota bacterium]